MVTVDIATLISIIGTIIAVLILVIVFVVSHIAMVWDYQDRKENR